MQSSPGLQVCPDVRAGSGRHLLQGRAEQGRARLRRVQATGQNACHGQPPSQAATPPEASLFFTWQPLCVGMSRVGQQGKLTIV